MTAEELAREILMGGKHSGISPVFIESICRDEMLKYKKKADVIKAVKKKLHIVHNSYNMPGGAREASNLLSAYDGNNMLLDRAFSAKLLSLHLSTRERLPFMDEFYGFIFDIIRAYSTVLDLGCGFHPFALPWMNAESIETYTALDVSVKGSELISAYFRHAGFSGGRAETVSIIDAIPHCVADVAFMLKLLPVLEQEKKGFSLRLLSTLRCRFLVVSFPIKSMSGKEKGMAQNYSRFMESILPETCRILQTRVIGTEIIYIIENKIGRV